VTEARQSLPLTETIHKDFSETPRPARFPEERFDLSCVTAMSPALHCGERSNHHLVRRGAGRSDASRSKSRDIEFVISAEDESRAESGGCRLSSRQPGFLQGDIYQTRIRCATHCGYQQSQDAGACSRYGHRP
jgi:hypothetical protein